MAYEEKISEKKGIAVNNFGIGLDAAIVHATNPILPQKSD